MTLCVVRFSFDMDQIAFCLKVCYLKFLERVVEVPQQLFKMISSNKTPEAIWMLR